MLLVPARKLAIVVAVNRKDPWLPASALFDAVMSRLPPDPLGPDRPHHVAALPSGPVSETGDITQLAGQYRLTLGDTSSFLAFASLFVPSLSVAPLDNQTLTVTFANADRPPERWRVTSDATLVDVSSRMAGAMKRDAAGRATHILVSDPEAGLVTFARVPWWDSSELTLLILLTALVTSVATLAALALSTAGIGRRARSSANGASPEAPVPHSPRTEFGSLPVWSPRRPLRS